MLEGKVYLEHLYHFSCPFCKGWFSIGDAVKKYSWCCPHCSKHFTVDYKELKLKPGYQTSEFWLTLVANLLPIVVLMGFLTTEESQLIQDQIVQVVALGSPFIVATASLIMYIYSRVKIKTQYGQTTVVELNQFEDLPH